MHLKTPGLSLSWERLCRKEAYEIASNEDNPSFDIYSFGYLPQSCSAAPLLLIFCQDVLNVISATCDNY